MIWGTEARLEDSAAAAARKVLTLPLPTSVEAIKVSSASQKSLNAIRCGSCVTLAQVFYVFARQVSRLKVFCQLKARYSIQR